MAELNEQVVDVVGEKCDDVPVSSKVPAEVTNELSQKEEIPIVGSPPRSSESSQEKKSDPPKIGAYNRSERKFDGMSEDDKHANIIRQMEHYFSDRNLISDRFLSGQIRQNDGWVAIELLLTFNLLKAMNTNEDEVVERISEFKSPSNLLEVDSDQKRVRRNVFKYPILTVRNKIAGQAINRTLYAEGFNRSTCEREIKEFFVKSGYTDDVQMRLDQEKLFMGSAFVTFATPEAKEWFAKKQWKFGDDSPIELKTIEQFFADKGRTSSKKDKEFEKIYTQHIDKGGDADDDLGDVTIPSKNSVLLLKEIPSECTREILKEKFSDYGRVFADFSKGDNQGYLRFPANGEAAKALDEVLTKQKENGVDGTDLVFSENIKIGEYRVLEGEEELVYWKDVERRKREYFQNCKRGRKRRGAGGGYRGGKRSRPRND